MDAAGSPWPMNLTGTRHLRPAVVILRNEANSEFAIRGLHGGDAIDLSLQEAHWVQQIRNGGVKDVLRKQFGSVSAAGDLQKLVNLVMRLHENGLLEPVANDELMQSIETLSTETKYEPVAEHSRRKGKQLRFRPSATIFARAIAHPVAFVVASALLVWMLAAAGKTNVLSLEGALAIVGKPAESLIKLWFGVLAASTLYSIAGAWVTWAALPSSLRSEPKYIISRRAVFFLVADFDARAIDMLSRTLELRIRALCLMLPWLGCCAAALASTPGNLNMPVLAFSFALVGLAEMNPGDRRQLVALLEAWVRETELLEKTTVFIRRGLLRFDQKATIGQGILASLMMLWLTGLTSVTAELLNSSVVTLGMILSQFDPNSVAKIPATRLADQSAAFLWLVVMAFTVVGGMVHLALIPFQNVISVATLPMKAFRPAALLRLDRSLNAASMMKVLSRLPIFAFSNEDLLHAIAARPTLSTARKGQAIVPRHSSSEHSGLFVVMEGTLKLGKEDTSLIAGDSFLARRAAEVVATSQAVLLELDASSMTSLVPAASANEIDHFEQTLIAIKLLQEAAALSYLTPRQTHSLARSATFRNFAAGELVIQEGDGNANSAYLVASGSLSIEIGGKLVAENITRGGLIGTTALIQDGARTATVKAKTATVCLEISRVAFLEASSSNAVVAMLLGNMTTEQFKINSAVQKGGAA